MNITETIDSAVAKLGSQRKLAELLGTPEQNISGYKKGRPISYQKHAQIAAAAGLQDLAIQILLQGMAENLSSDIEHEAQVKAGIQAMLNAFPQT